MPSSDVHLARGEAKDTVMDNMAHVNLPTNSNKQYDHDEIIKVVKTATRVLTETFNELSDGKGMSELLDSTPNNINSVKPTQSVSYMATLKESKEEAAKANKAAKAKDPNAAIIVPMIMDIEAARGEGPTDAICTPKPWWGQRKEWSSHYGKSSAHTSSTR